ncbi:MAG: phycobiliprotein lyase [Leptolyngbya sp. SIO4C5]|uniref:phycobiliprotein lyase n=1 Tax=Sphaerothrix gracilis TaxID=3151835 RepID=UPI0013BEFF15|nr:phycobiliprotein lyase [Leptolyngbya sp. SIO4C5]
MTAFINTVEQSSELLVKEFFQLCEGNWRSERRYYTLHNDEIQEVVSYLTIRFLKQESSELLNLAQMHQLENSSKLVCGAFTSWESNYKGPSAKTLTGSTIFGVSGTTLYRDRGFATSKPVCAQFYMRTPKTMCLKTEYGGSAFEEEIKLIGSGYRTRQTIISRAGEEQMIGQYLEKRTA